MNISQQPSTNFKGVIKIQTSENRNAPVKTEYIETTKKEDALILSATVDNLESIAHKRFRNPNYPGGFKDHTYGKDTTIIHKAIENIINKKIEQPNLGNEKNLYMGGFRDNNGNLNKYDTSYNKIYYRDVSSDTTSPRSNIKIDLMSPDERMKASGDVLYKIQDKLDEMTEVNDGRLHPLYLSDSSLSKVKFGELEEKLTNTLQILDGHLTGPDTTNGKYDDLSPDEVYESLISNIRIACGSDDTRDGWIYKTEDVNNKDLYLMKLALHSIECANKHDDK